MEQYKSKEQLRKEKELADKAYAKLVADIKQNTIGSLYIFYGTEHYLMHTYLDQMRKLLCPGGLDGFNYKRFEGKHLTAQQLEEAVDSYPLTGGRVLIEIHDYNLFAKSKSKENETAGTGEITDELQQNDVSDSEKARIYNLLKDLPGYICLIFIYSAAEFKADKRQNIVKEVLKIATAVPFNAQEESKLIEWIRKHFRQAGKEINDSDARYLIEITDGLMTTIHSEIQKISAHAKDSRITRKDIDAVVIPVLDAVVYMLTDAIVNRENVRAVNLLGRLLQMREPPHMLAFSISKKMRQLLAARVLLNNRKGIKNLMEMCDIKQYPAEKLMNTAGNTSLAYCCEAVNTCAKTAKELNSLPDPEARIVELVSALLLFRQ